MEYSLYLSLGSNIEPGLYYLNKALELLSGKFTCRRISSLYKSAPRDDEEQADFYNLCVHCSTVLADPLAVLEITQAIEEDIGRQKTPGRPKGPRAIDIDILLFGDFRMCNSRLTIPHRAMLERNFVLVPLLEILRGFDDGLIRTFDLERRIAENSSQRLERIGRMPGPGDWP